MEPMRSGIARIALAASLLAPAVASAQDAAPARVGAGKRVSIEYTIRLEDGTLADSNVGREPLVYAHGAGELMPGLERALEGMAVGESKQGALEAKEAYGAIDAELFQEVEISRIPEADRRVGAKLIYRDETGEGQIVRVHEVRGDRIVVDMNHPFAGSDVRYEVKVLKVE
jgi:FKBP-type peptidyl-prolyl cis-trans isomerase SlyD